MTPVSNGRKKTAPSDFRHRGPDAPLAHHRPGYPLSGCFPAEPDSVSPGTRSIAGTWILLQLPLDTEVMPWKIQGGALRILETDEPKKTFRGVGDSPVVAGEQREQAMRAVEELTPRIGIGTAAACRSLGVWRATVYRRRRPKTSAATTAPRPWPARVLPDAQRRGSRVDPFCL